VTVDTCGDAFDCLIPVSGGTDRFCMLGEFCGDDADCTGSEFCLLGACVVVCGPSGQCPTNTVCLRGVCVRGGL
jgi:hypothetical protein